MRLSATLQGWSVSPGCRPGLVRRNGCGALGVLLCELVQAHGGPLCGLLGGRWRGLGRRCGNDLRALFGLFCGLLAKLRKLLFSLQTTFGKLRKLCGAGQFHGVGGGLALFALLALALCLLLFLRGGLLAGAVPVGLGG